MKRLFLLDAYALIYRAYYALIRSPRITSNGLNTSAIFGFCNTLDELLRKENPTHLAVCFDPSGPTFRHEAYPEYKAQRQKQPEDITASIPWIKRILSAMKIPVVEVAGYEADDVIGTLSRRAEAAGFDTYMMTPDKDYAQLVTDHVFMYRPALRGEGFEVRGPELVRERFGVPEPERVIDLLALEGDTSDNVPGCPGVGEKTARRLIEEWGTVENLIANADKLKGALKTKIETNAEQIVFSKFLVTIKTDAPVDIEPDDLVRNETDTDALREIYRELEFRSLLKKLNSPNTAAPAKSASHAIQPSLFDIPEGETVAEISASDCPTGEYTTADTAEKVDSLVEKALASERVGLATYAVGEEAMRADLRGIALAIAPCSATFIPASDGLLERLRPLFESESTEIVSHDVKRDMILLRRAGINFGARHFDTAIAHYLIDSESRHSLPLVMLRYLGLESPLFPSDMRHWYPAAALDKSEAATRYCQEADTVLRLARPLADEIESLGMTALLHDIELPLIKVLAEMEWTGVRLDPAPLYNMSKELNDRIDSLEAEAFELAGGPFNLSSPYQVGEILFGRLKLDPKAKKTAKGGYSTTEAILEKHRKDHPLVEIILNVRKLRKLLATYADALPRLINPETGKIHTTFNQTVTTTGRISSTNPNLQNIPIRTDDGREIRRAFIADPGCLFMSADYSQIELRLIACLSHDPVMVASFLAGHDIHRATAAKIYHEEIENVTDAQRRAAKTANFGIIYGISAFGLSERLGMARSEAKELIDGYYRTYPHIREYIDHAIEEARNNGYVTTIMGRRRQLPDINSRNAVVRSYAERNAVNAPLQGSAADIIKIAMVNIYREIGRRGLRSRMIMQVHDELIFNIEPEELADMQTIVAGEMENAWHGDVPLEVSMGTATNWLEAH